MEIVSDVFVFAICSGHQWARSRKHCPLCFQRIGKFSKDYAGVYASDFRTPMALDFWSQHPWIYMCRAVQLLGGWRGQFEADAAKQETFWAKQETFWAKQEASWAEGLVGWTKGLMGKTGENVEHGSLLKGLPNASTMIKKVGTMDVQNLGKGEFW